MARGWESKSVESQIEERQNLPAGGDKQQVSKKDLERQRTREGLESSRRGILRQLETTTSDLRRKSLKAALDHFDRELKKLDSEK